ncbi:protein-L-isoaspartate(D-aspartate) O-methyltransferase [Flavisolibacter sp. BT320]|nr:protein-L-isoaspartate(D-aspartate) O-methyltransferase [Flavisolibacter longurius]
MNRFEDNAVQQRLRRQLVNGIHDKGITDPQVLEVIFSTPRHWFMPQNLQKEAYIDKAFPIGEGQTISQPYTVAYQTQLLNLQPTDRVLEIGTGSGYQAVILAQLASEVFSMERQKKLFMRNKSFAYLYSFSNLHLFYGDGYEGLPVYAPFDKILLTAASPGVPQKLVEQLKRGSQMVLPLGKEHPQKMVRITKADEEEIIRETFDDFSFVPMLSGKND